MPTCRGSIRASGAHPMKIGISGSYGMHNLGDEAILEAMVAMIRERDPGAEVRIFSRNAAHTNCYHGFEAVDVRVLSDQQALRASADLDVLILGGGGILYDAEIDLYLREADLATSFGIPVVVFAVGAGPMNDPAERSEVDKILSRAAVVTTRDEESMELLRSCGVAADIMEVAADPALLLEPCGRTQAEAILVSQGIPVGEKLVGVSVRQPDVTCPWLDEIKYHELLAAVVDRMIDEWKVRAVFIPMEPEHDIPHAEIVVGKMRKPQKATILKNGLRPSEVMGVTGLFQLAVGMRLHFMMLSAAMGTPIAPLLYAPKVSAFIRQLGLGFPERDISSITPQDYFSFIQDIWRRKDDIKARFASAILDLRQRAVKSGVLLFERVFGEEIIREQS